MPTAHPQTNISQRLAARTLELVDIASESRAEGEIVARMRSMLETEGVDVRDLGDTCLFVEAPAGRPFILLAGHLDTVPAQDNRPGRIEDGRVFGLGSADMKAGVAVMLELALAGVGFGYLFFGREELPPQESALTPVLERHPELCSAELAIMLEPTANAIHAGCLGSINADWIFHGRSGHSARPWQADNAIYHAARAIADFAEIEPEKHVCSGLEFNEVVSVTGISGGIARNVIPDRVEAQVNFRYAPDRSPAEAEERLRTLCGKHGDLDIVSNSPSAPVSTENVFVQRLIEHGVSVKAKQAWTPVAEFAAHGVGAINFGPGDPIFAHQRDEQVSIDALTECYELLRKLAP